MFSYTNADEVDGLYHVGTLNIANKSDQSHEWNGLSVSNCPDAWRQICGCCGTTWRLIPDHSDRFLLYHDLDENDMDTIKNWAINTGYFEQDMEYRVWWHDDEYDEDRYFVFSRDEYDDARDEYEFKLEEEYDGVRFEELENGLKATSQIEAMSLVKIEPAMYSDIAVLLYAEEKLGCDGVWWEDRYEPYALSAPRGVIFNSKVSGFEAVDANDAEEGF